MPTPVKYSSPGLRDAYKALETESVDSMTRLLPPELAEEVSPFITGSLLTAEEKRLLKAADRLSALVKCMEEQRSGNHEFDAALTQQLFLRFFPDTPFPVLPSVVVCHSYFLQSELIERAEKSPLIFPKEKTRGLNALNFNFLLSFLVLLGFWLCVCLQRSGLCPTSPRLHARKVRQKRLPVSAPVHYPTAKAGRLSACPP